MRKKIAKAIILLLTVGTMSVFSACGSQVEKENQTELNNNVEEAKGEASQEKESPTVPAFSTIDLEGNTVTEEIFSQKDLTVVNVWGTFCGPCISEMPELGEWSKEMPDNVQLVGLIIDIAGEDDTEHIELAKEIVSQSSAEYVHMIANEDFAEILSEVVGVPTTFFVDKEGKIVGNAIVGVNVEGYKQTVEDYLNE